MMRDRMDAVMDALEDIRKVLREIQDQIQTLQPPVKKDESCKYVWDDDWGCEDRGQDDHECDQKEGHVGRHHCGCGIDGPDPTPHESQGLRHLEATLTKIAQSVSSAPACEYSWGEAELHACDREKGHKGIHICRCGKENRP